MRLASLCTAVVVFVVLGLGSSEPSYSSALSQSDFGKLSQRCAPRIDQNILRAIANIESHFNPFAVRNNTKHLEELHPSRNDAVKRATEWLSRGDSVDLGLMQINSINLRAAGLTVEGAFDPCLSLGAAARILTSAYAQNSSTVDRQAALLIALSRYNTGNALAGLANGYVGKILAAHEESIKVSPASLHLPDAEQPDWNVWAGAPAVRHDGAAWLVGSEGTPNFLIGAGAQPSGEPHALSPEPGAAPGK